MRTARATRHLVGTVALLCAAALAIALAYHYVLAPRWRVAPTPPDITVTIPEGVTSFEVDRILADAGVTTSGAVTAIAERDKLEGMLFPDTYRFQAHTDPERVVRRLVATYQQKAAPLLAADVGRVEHHLIVASLLEREVTDERDRRIVAGIIEKRLAAGMRLQIDATVCYAKKVAQPGSPCYPITSVDLTNRSPYNTYLYRGLPPGPIGNPGVGALTASLHAEASPYWFYLSDPATGRTVFSVTNDEHNANRARYLGN